MIDVIARLERSATQRDASKDKALVRGIQRNLELTRSAHDYNMLVRVAWTGNNQQTWSEAWEMWDSIVAELGPESKTDQ